MFSVLGLLLHEGHTILIRFDGMELEEAIDLASVWHDQDVGLIELGTTEEMERAEASVLGGVTL